MAAYTVVLEGGSPWGFRLKGGKGTGVPLVVSKINPGSKAASAHLSIGDTVEKINGQPTNNLDQNDAQNLIRCTASSLKLALSKPPSLNGPVIINHNNNNMSVDTSTSVSGQQSVSNFAVDDETVSVDGVTFHGFSPSNVSVTRTTTTKVTKTTRSRSPSPIRGRSSSSENLNAYPKQMVLRYDSEPENEAPPVKFMSGVIWTPPGSKVEDPNPDSYCTCNKPHPSPCYTNHTTKECSQITSRPPRPREPVAHRREPGKPKRHRSSFFIRPRSRSSDASTKEASPWKPVTFQPRSKDDSAKYAFSSPPLPPPPPESDTEDAPPVIPPKPKVVKRKLFLSANQPQAPPEIQLKPVANGRVRRTSRGAEMFFKRQAKPDSPDEPPPPRNNQYPTSPTSPTSPKQTYKPMPQSSSPYTQSSPYSQSPPKQDGYHQPVRPHRADSGSGDNPGYMYDSSGETWPAPPPPVTSPTEAPPRRFDSNPGTQSSPPKQAWSPQQATPSSYQPIENKSPSVWSPAPSTSQVKAFKPVKLDLNSKPKPWKSNGASQPDQVSEPAPTLSSQHPTWQPSPQPSQPTAPVTNGDMHSHYRPNERQQAEDVQSSPYRPGDLHQDQERYNPSYQKQQPPHSEPPQSEPDRRYGDHPLSPQDSRRPEFRPVPEGYSSGLPRSVSPTVTLLQYQREREKEHRSQADYLPPDSSLMPPPLAHRAPSVATKQPAAVVAYPLHAGTNVSVSTEPNDLPEGAVYQKQTVEGDVIHTDTYYPVKTREVTKKTIHKEAPRYEGIGPQDETGLPIGLRAHVKEENRHDWYKEMFKTIHKQDRPEDEIDQSYMDALIQEANMYEPSYSFPDAVDVKNNDDNVFEDEAPSVVQSSPVKKAEQWSHDPTLDASPPASPPRRHHSPNTSARNTIDRYHQQPRSIIDYEPGKSSLSSRDKSPTAQLYNPPVEPISAVQNTKRSTTLPRDFAQFNQVPAESPSAKPGPPKQGTNPSIFSTNPNPCDQSTFINSHDSLNSSCQSPQSMISLISVHSEFRPIGDVVLDSGIKTSPLRTSLVSRPGTVKIPIFSNENMKDNVTNAKDLAELGPSHRIESKITCKLHELPHKLKLTETENSEYLNNPLPGIFRKPHPNLGGTPAPTPIRPIGAAESDPASSSNESCPHGHSIEEQVDNTSERNNEPPLQYGPRGMADGCPGVDHAGIVCHLNANGKVLCHDCDTGETFQPRHLPRPTSLFEPYSLERERERISSQPSSASPRNSGISLDFASTPTALDSTNNGLQNDKSGPSIDGDDGEVQRPGSLSPDQLTADGEQKLKRGRVGAKHQKLKHIKKHRSERHSPKDEDSDMVPYSERPNAKNFAPMEKRRAISAENLSLAVKSPAFNQESYQKYATGLKKASQQSKNYEDLIRFYSEVNRHLEKDEKERTETMKEKYMPKPAQLETFYRTLKYFSELEMAAECGEDMSDKGKIDNVCWDMHSDTDLKSKGKDIFELYDFYEKLERGAIGTPTTEERLEQIRMQTYLQKAKELEARHLRVGQLYEWYENIYSRGSITPSLASSQVASLPDFENTDDEGEGGLPSKHSQKRVPAESTENRVPRVDLSLEELESLIPRVPMVDPPLESFPSQHRPLGKSSTLPRLYTKKQNRTWSPVSMPSIKLRKEGKQKSEDQSDDIVIEEEVKNESFSGLSKPPSGNLDAGEQPPGRKTPPFMVTGRPPPVIRRKSFDKAISASEDNEELTDEIKKTCDTIGSGNNLNNRRKGPETLSGLENIPVSSILTKNQQDIQVTPPASPRADVVRPGSPEASAPPKLPERSMSTGVLGIKRVIGPVYNPGLGRLQRWNRADLSQIEDEDVLPDEDIPAPAESRIRAPPIGRVGKMQSDSSLPMVARGAGKPLARNDMKFTQSQNEVALRRGWRDFNTSPQPFKLLNQIKWPIRETDQESSLASFDLEQLDCTMGDDGIDNLPATLDPVSGIQHHKQPITEVTNHQSQVSLGQKVESQLSKDPSSELNHKSKIHLFEEKIAEQCSSNQHHPPAPPQNTSEEQMKAQKEIKSDSPAIHVRKSSWDQDAKMSNEDPGGLVFGIFRKSQPKQEEEIPNWPPTPSPQQDLYTPPGASYLTQSLPHNFNFSEAKGKPGLHPSEGAGQLWSTSASADCAGVDWGKKIGQMKPKKLDHEGKVITRYAFSMDEVYEERTPVPSRNASPLPPSHGRYNSFGNRLGIVDDRPRLTRGDAQSFKSSPVFESTKFQSSEDHTPVASRNISPVPHGMVKDVSPSKRLGRTDVNSTTKTQGATQADKSSPVVESIPFFSHLQPKQNIDSSDSYPEKQERNAQLYQDITEVQGLHLDLKDLETADGNLAHSPQDSYTPSCSYSPSPTPSHDYLAEASSSQNQWYSPRHSTQGISPRSSQLVSSSINWLEPELEPENVFYWDTYIPNKYEGETSSDKCNDQEAFGNWDFSNKEKSNSNDRTPTNSWSGSYSTLQALSPEPSKYKIHSKLYTQPPPNHTDYPTRTPPEYPEQKLVKNSRQRTDLPSNVNMNSVKFSTPAQSKKHPESPPKYPRGHPVDKWLDPVPLTRYQSPGPPPLYKGDALVPQKSSTLPQQRKSPRMKEEPIRQSSRPLSSTLPRAKSKPRSLETSGLSAAERLGIKTAPPQRTPSTGSKPSRHSSGSDKIYNYRDPPPTLDKTKAERVIEEERKKRERLQAEEQQQRRHSDYAPIKSPIITNERFRDPVISAKDDGRKQEIKACAIAVYPFKAQTHKELSFDKGDIIYLLRKIDKNWYEGEHHGHAGIFPSSYVEVVTSLDDAKKAQVHGPGLEGKARAKYKFSGETQLELNFNKGEYIVLVKKIDANWWEGCIGDRKGIFPSAYVEVLREPTGVASPPAMKSPPPTKQAPYQPFNQQMVQSSPKQQQRPQAAPSNPAGRSSLGYAGSYGSSQREPERYMEEPASKPSRTLAAGQDLYVATFAYVPQNEDEIELLEGDSINVLEKCDDGWYVGMSERTGMFGTFPGNYVYKRET